jgi:hypothetical protein
MKSKFLRPSSETLRSPGNRVGRSRVRAARYFKRVLVTTTGPCYLFYLIIIRSQFLVGEGPIRSTALQGAGAKITFVQPEIYSSVEDSTTSHSLYHTGTQTSLIIVDAHRQAPGVAVLKIFERVVPGPLFQRQHSPVASGKDLGDHGSS